MKLCIVGSEAANVVNGWIQKAGYIPVTKGYDYKVELVESETVKSVIIDGIDCELERKLVLQMELNGIPRFVLQRAGGVRSDRAVRIVYPKSMQEKVEKGVYQGLMLHVGNYATKRQHRVTKAARAARVAGILFILGLLANIAYPQERFPVVRFWDGLQIVNAGDLLNNAVRVNCVLGCGAATQYTSGVNSPGALTGNVLIFRDIANNLYPVTDQTPLPVTVSAGLLRLDNSFFMLNTHYFMPIGEVFDDVSPGTLTEDFGGIGRSTAYRARHVNLRNNSGTEVGTTTNPLTTNSTPSTTASATGDGQCLGLTTTSATVVASNANRRFFTIYARETNTDYIFLKLGGTATTSDLPLAPGQAFTLSTHIYTGVIDGLSNSGTQPVCWVEL